MKGTAMKKSQKGFTLVEIAIVLVIIGLLLGGILKGQEMITQAKIKNVIADITGVSAAMYGYQDRYRALPGDDKGATRWAGGPAVPATAGNGVIEGNTTPPRTPTNRAYSGTTCARRLRRRSGSGTAFQCRLRQDGRSDRRRRRRSGRRSGHRWQYPAFHRPDAVHREPAGQQSPATDAAPMDDWPHAPRSCAYFTSSFLPNSQNCPPLLLPPFLCSSTSHYLILSYPTINTPSFLRRKKNHSLLLIKIFLFIYLTFPPLCHPFF
jgi:prepilin-type N-terminal cleavage/methylation domain-containing protein